MRTIGNGVVLIVAVAPLLSTCDKAEQAQPNASVSANEGWSWLHRTLWPMRYVDASAALDANPSYPNTDNAWAARKTERSGQRRRHRAEQVPAGAPHCRDAVLREVCHVG